MIALAVALVAQSAAPTGSPLDAYQQCVLRAALIRSPHEDFANLKGREISRLVKNVANATCGAELQAVKQVLPQDWQSAAETFDATDVGMLATGAVQLVPAKVCATQLRAHDQCLR